MRTTALVVGLAVLLVASSASADTILYQTSFDTDTTDVPGTYAPLSFDPVGYSRPYLVFDPATAPTDAVAVVESGILHLRRTGPGSGDTSLGFAAPEITILSSDLGTGAAFPDVFSLSLDMGGTPGNQNWWGGELRINDRIHDPILYGFYLGPCASCWSFSDGSGLPTHLTTASGAFVPSPNVLYPVDMTITKLTGAYQFDVSITNPSTSTTYTDSKVVSYAYDLTGISFVRQGSGGGDVIFDNLTISTSVPEPTTGLLLGLGLLGVSVRRRV